MLGEAIRSRLDRCLPDWRGRIACLGQVEAVENREAGHRGPDDEVFEALTLAVLSNNTDWSTVERCRAALREPFFDFSLDRYAKATDEEIERIVD